LIDQFGQLKGQIEPLLDYLPAARGGDPVVLQAVLLAVAEIKLRTEENRTRIEAGIDRYPFTSLEVEKLLDSAADLYRNHPHPGVHSAAELVLRRWGREQTLAPRDEQSRSNSRPLDGPGWELGPQGHTLALLPGPLEFWMGSPDHEEGRFPHESRHYRRIDRSLAIATKEVTIAQYRAFKPGYRQDTRYTREPDCPVNTLSWYEAAEYCNWLSEKAGIAPSQWCYPIKFESGMIVPGDSVDRHGYRLPTEAEWEYCCRAATETARPFGDSDDVLPRYALTSMTPGDRTRPVGRLLPNEFGLFDILGNVWEWCHDGQANPSADPYPRYPEGTVQHPAPDRLRTTTVESTLRRMLRGGAFDYAPTQARSAHRYCVSPGLVEGTIGFRVVRTLPSLGRRLARGHNAWEERARH
jgi:formylglycine-generating enzyme required for sulfatase activity